VKKNSLVIDSAPVASFYSSPDSCTSHNQENRSLELITIMNADTRGHLHQHLASSGLDALPTDKRTVIQNLSLSSHLLRWVQQSSSHKEEETARASYMEGLPTGPWNQRFTYQGKLACDVTDLASLMTVGQELHVIHCVAPAVLVAHSQQFSSALHGPPPLITAYCGHQVWSATICYDQHRAIKFLDMGPEF
jgi:hypothetical protein